MNRRLVVVAVALLVALATPVLAADAGLEIASENKSPAELASAAQLADIQVDSSNSRASLFGATGSTATTNGDGTSVSGSTGEFGVVISPNTDLAGVSVSISSNTDAGLPVELQDSSGNTLATTTASSGSATLTADLDAGETYRVVVIADGNTVGSNFSPSFPYTSSDVDITAGIDQGSTTTGARNAISDVTAVTYADNGTGGQYVGAQHDADRVEEGFVDLEVSGTSATVEWQGYDGSSWTAITSTSYSSSGNKTVSLPDTYQAYRANITFASSTGGTGSVLSEGVLFNASTPEASNLQPADGVDVTDSSVNVSVDVADGDFTTQQGDEVEAELFVKAPSGSSFSQEYSENVTSNSTVNTSLSLSEAGQYEYYWLLTDDYGDSVQTATRTVETPATLKIRNESAPSQAVSGASVEVTFYGDNTVITRNDSDGDGQINLSGLPADEPIIAVVEADGYLTRNVVIPSLYEQQTAYLIPDTAETVEVRFRLQDNTGVFGEGTRIIVQKALTVNGSTEYRTMAADEVGVSGFTTQLVSGDRYRIKVVSTDGDSRTLGTYTADVAEEVTLEIGSVQFGANARGDEYAWQASYSNESAPPTITFKFNDSADATTNLDLRVYQQSNTSNVILDESFAGPFGLLVETVDVQNASLYDANWVVEFEADRAGETISGSWVVGPNSGAIGLPIDSQWAGWASIALLVVIGAILGGISPELGGLGVSVSGGMLLWVGWLPSFIGGGVVVLALLITGLYAVSQRRGL